MRSATNKRGARLLSCCAVDSAAPDDSSESTERLLADAVLALEQRGEAGLQEFLGAHASDADAEAMQAAGALDDARNQLKALCARRPANCPKPAECP
jgi:hypothetical protein